MGLSIYLVLLVILALLLAYFLRNPLVTIDVRFLLKQEDGTMAIATEADLFEDGEITIKLLPVTATDTPGKVENVDFTSDNADVALTVDIDVPLLFHATSAASITEGDVKLHLEADGRLGEGVNQISKDFIVHLKKRDSVDVKFDVTTVR